MAELKVDLTRRSLTGGTHLLRKGIVQVGMVRHAGVKALHQATGMAEERLEFVVVDVGRVDDEGNCPGINQLLAAETADNRGATSSSHSSSPDVQRLLRDVRGRRDDSPFALDDYVEAARRILQDPNGRAISVKTRPPARAGATEARKARNRLSPCPIAYRRQMSAVSHNLLRRAVEIPLGRSNSVRSPRWALPPHGAPPFA